MEAAAAISELRANPRLRLGLWLILLILIGYVLTWLNDYGARLQGELDQALDRHQRLLGLQGGEAWLERAEAARSLRVSVEQQLWRAESRGLGQAEFQTWLTRVMERANLTEGLRLTMGQPQDGAVKATWYTTAQLEGPFEAESLEKLLFSLVQHSSWVRVEHLRVRYTRSPRFSLHLRVYFQGPGQGGGA